MLKAPLWHVVFSSIAVVLALLFFMPNVVPAGLVINRFLPDSRVNLGLDLKGGASLMLEVQLDGYSKDILNRCAQQIRAEARSAKVRITDLKVRDEHSLFIEAAQQDLQTLIAIAKKVGGDGYEIRQDGEGISVALDYAAIEKSYASVIEQTIEIVRRRVDESGTKEIDIQRYGDRYISLQIPGVEDPSEIKNLLGKTAKLTFHLVKTDYKASSGFNPGIRLLPYDGADDVFAKRLAVDSRAIISGDMLVDARTVVAEGSPRVSFKLSTLGAKIFGQYTTNHVGVPFAIVLDDVVISAPVVREPILTGEGQISGNFTVASANELALLLRAGALPAPIKIVEERVVGPSLGADSITSGINAAAVGACLVFLFMFLFYYWFGLLANLALILNVVMMIAILGVFGATLTLPGIAGIVLTLGMAVDANVLILERIKEELKSGKNHMLAIKAGYDMAKATIIDSNLTTVLAGVILYAFGSGPVRGFAVTLIVGIMCSMFTAVTVTRLITFWWVQRYKPRSIVL